VVDEYPRGEFGAAADADFSKTSRRC